MQQFSFKPLPLPAHFSQMVNKCRQKFRDQFNLQPIHCKRFPCPNKCQPKAIQFSAWDEVGNSEIPLLKISLKIKIKCLFLGCILSSPIKHMATCLPQNLSRVLPNKEVAELTNSLPNQYLFIIGHWPAPFLMHLDSRLTFNLLGTGVSTSNNTMRPCSLESSASPYEIQ